MMYSGLVGYYKELESTPGKLKKTKIISRLLEEAEEGDLKKVVSLLQGRVFPQWSDKEIGIANMLMIKTISSAMGVPQEQVEKGFKKIGDLGLVAEDIGGSRKQKTLFSKKLTVERVFENMQKLADIEGKGSQDRKFQLISELISSASPLEAKYIVRTAIGDLRIGVAEGMIRDAIAKAYFSDVVWDEKRILDLMKEKGKRFLVEKGLLEKLESKGANSSMFRKNNVVFEESITEIKKTELWKPKGKTDYILLSSADAGAELKGKVLSAVEWAWFLRPDYGEVAEIAKESGLEALENTGVKIGEPYKVLLSEKAPSLEDALKEYENCALEWKYDGARVCIHKRGDRIWIFTRRLEDITRQFPEVAEWARNSINPRDAIVEGEMIGFSKGRPMPFQFLSQRIKRKYDIEKMAKEIPVQVNLFDIVFCNGREMFKEKQRDRWNLVKKSITPVQGKFQLAKHIETKDLEKAERFYKESLDAHQEGLMVKNMDAVYQPGRRVGFWLKVKPVLENLDLVIIGATWGTGKRAGWLGSFMLGCRDSNTGKFLECGMIGTGIKEKGEGVTFDELTTTLKPYIDQESGTSVRIKPKVVVEVSYEEIQKSPNYESGYALRFPRVLRLRTSDKSPQQADSLERVEKLYGMQKGNRGKG